MTSDTYELQKELKKDGAIGAMDLWTMIVLVVAIGCGAGIAESYFKSKRHATQQDPMTMQKIKS